MHNPDVLAIEPNRAAMCRSAPGIAPVSHGRVVVGLPELAELLGIALDMPAGMGDIEFAVRRLQPGEALCRAGDEFDAFYVVRSGVLTTVSLDGSATEQGIAFPMRGEAGGAHAFDRGYYTASALPLAP